MNFLSAYVDIDVDDSKLSQQLDRAKAAVMKTIDKIRDSFSRMATSFKAAWDSIVHYAKWAAVGLTAAFALATRAAMQQEDVNERLEITLRATGYAAGFSKQQLLEQAKALQSITRFSDESITALQTMLLTFKNIRGEEFKRATAAALDMATAEAAVSGRAIDLTSVSMQLGKALNEPLIGMSALSRVGIQFTDQQKNLIRTLVASGRVAEAQRVILAELESRYGGMSQNINTASGALAQMRNALGEVVERIGAAFLPGIKETALAIKAWAERNEERIGHWAQVAAAYITYAKDVLWAFVQFLLEDWKAGQKVAIDVSIELFKGFGESLVAVMGWIGKKAAKTFGEEMIYGLVRGMDIFGPLRRRIPGLRELDELFEPIRKRIAGAAGKQLIEMEISPLAPRLKAIWEDVGESVKKIVPPELGVKLEAPLEKLKTSLSEIGTVAEEVEEPLEKALVEPIEKSNKMMEDARAKLQQWSFDAQNIWGNLSSIAVSTLDGVSDALANLVVKGKADFASLAESFMMDVTRMIAKALMAKALVAFLPGLFGAGGMIPLPGAQEGGKVTKTGLAVIHKGEEFTGVGTEGKPKPATALNINVSAIDAAGTYQFLSRNKRAIATMLQGTLSSNHPLRRSI